MIEPEGVGDFLAHHMPLLIVVIVGAGVEIGVVHLGRTLSDVNTSRDIDTRQTEPAVVAVSGVAYLGSAGNHCATFIGLASHNGG